MKPIFLFSLPRAGSTLLQKILMSHKDITSVAEPWLMLPFCYAFKREGTLSEYSHAICYTAFEDFINNLPNKEKDYYSALRKFAFELYEKHCLNNERYFLDKTPRYYNIIPEINKIFPDAKFIFLFRNPVHVMASIINTWGKGRLKILYAFIRDLTHGPKALSEGYELLRNKSIAVQYEKLVKNPEIHIRKICEYLELSYDESMLKSFINQDTKGRMGDLTGTKKYKSISSKSLSKWEKTFNTPFRKKLIYDYIESLNKEVLKIQGYNKEDVLNEIERLKVFISPRDIIDLMDYSYSTIVKYTKANIFFGKNTRKWTKDNYLS